MLLLFCWLLFVLYGCVCCGVVVIGEGLVCLLLCFVVCFVYLVLSLFWGLCWVFVFCWKLIFCLFI